MAYEKQLDHEIRSILKEFDTDGYLTLGLGSLTFNGLFTDRLMMTTVVQSGISYRFFEMIQRITPFTENEWAVFLELSTKTLTRYKMENRYFKTLHSEKIMELAEVTREGLEMFGDAELFKQWLHTANYALGNKKPMELLKDSYGKELVLKELTHINHGIFV
ncbi:type II RES/Xre toxin-antitoxin system antitoxin [Parapedobacter sp. 10938]|uniref:type II RES/Xre toxin-antitoxin system antitoxin n=1 Tax=Parapedobacter flavus TaxID=3110225 RepID=UPI002DBF48C2|nr:antitoxin Xre/MbcA/ParS toxin-binding domain-containing protein [Parapedobacter sp. 10938]MEC3881368.1 antitoxin Xre/MbcA/ParS toxin-binding domain-containing protein [Parapedobacter sp. 10938]